MFLGDKTPADKWHVKDYWMLLGDNTAADNGMLKVS